MACVIRELTAQSIETASANSTGNDYAFIAFSIFFTIDIQANVITQILQYTGTGNIKSICSCLVLGADGSIIEDRATFGVLEDRKTLAYLSPRIIPAGARFNVLLGIGNY
jgi:hypothetical protein